MCYPLNMAALTETGTDNTVRGGDAQLYVGLLALRSSTDGEGGLELGVGRYDAHPRIPLRGPWSGLNGRNKEQRAQHLTIMGWVWSKDDSSRESFINICSASTLARFDTQYY